RYRLSFPTRRSSDLSIGIVRALGARLHAGVQIAALAERVDDGSGQIGGPGQRRRSPVSIDDRTAKLPDVDTRRADVSCESDSRQDRKSTRLNSSHLG